jgi:hypothetical protein
MTNRGVPYHFALARQENEVVDGHDDNWPREFTRDQASKVVVGVGMIVGEQTEGLATSTTDRCTDARARIPLA